MIKRLFAVVLACLSSIVAATAHADAAAAPPAEAVRAAYAVANADAHADAGLLKSVMTSSPTIIDEFAPYQWTGTGAIDRYTTALKAWLAAGGLTDLRVVAEAPRFWDVSGDRAWLVLPAVFTYEIGGKGNAESGVYAFVFTRTGGHWRVSSWAWATTAAAETH